MEQYNKKTGKIDKRKARIWNCVTIMRQKWVKIIQKEHGGGGTVFSYPYSLHVQIISKHFYDTFKT